MDRTQASGACNVGSIPAGSTEIGIMCATCYTFDMNRDKVGLVTLAAFLLVAALIIAHAARAASPVVASFEGCLEARNPAHGSHPRMCTHGDTTFVEQVLVMPTSCVIAGCGREICIEAIEAAYVSDTCEYDPADACYVHVSSCERLPNGHCGWVVNAALSACLLNPEAAIPNLNQKEVM